MHTLLAHLKPGERGHVAAIDWDRIPVRDSRRLRELGLVEGANIEVLGRDDVSPSDAIVVRIGRTIAAVDRMHATAIAIAQGAAA